MALTLQGTSVCYLNSDMGSNVYTLPMLKNEKDYGIFPLSLKPDTAISTPYEAH